MKQERPLFHYHSIEENYSSGWIPTRTVEEWKQKMTEQIISKALEKEKEGYRVKYEFDERDADYFDEDVSKMVLTIEIYKEID